MRRASAPGVPTRALAPRVAGGAATSGGGDAPADQGRQVAAVIDRLPTTLR
jgi:hypothetical protein